MFVKQGRLEVCMVSEDARILCQVFAVVFMSVRMYMHIMESSYVIAAMCLYVFYLLAPGPLPPLPLDAKFLHLLVILQR